MGVYTAASVIVIAMMGPTSSRAPAERRVDRPHPLAQVALDVLDHHDRVVHHEPDREHDREQRQQVHREPEDLHQEHRADERDRDGHDRHEHRAQRAEEQEDDDDDDEQRLAERPLHLVDGVPDVGGGVVGDARLDLLRDLLLQRVHLGADALDDVERVRVRERPDADEDRGLPAEVHRRVVVLGAEHHVGDVAEPDDRAVLLADRRAAGTPRRTARSVFAVRFTWTSEPLVCPTAAR